ncbi:MAG TPA: hypothetical protein VFW62_05575 [bacterium]|nr:hypothetical protein [bacterium]HKY62285.1 hypothetical protein [bacterium]
MKRTRITVDLVDPELMKMLKLEAAVQRRSMRDIVQKALQGFFSNKREQQALVKRLEPSFVEWDNPRDANYDRL